ncbi:RNA polymerase sigma factor [Paenibacillus camerounensis]|uniref:RNA polymerase sigma factor n=1 Tax=Paenibacillus camerounensis TaxID=1243663 RepID=UPI0005AB6E9A|nr:sigma-70 family RNA polymerase sigma factor [Paenibacillus camerounensis]
MNDPQREAFFNQLYSKYHHIIFAYIMSHVSHRETSKDLLQEVFLRIWNQIHVGIELGIDESRYWIYRIAKNLVIDHYRRRSTQNRTEDKIKADAVSNNLVSKSAEDTFEIKEQILNVEQAIRRLPDNLYRVLILQYIGQMNSSEIGELLELPAGTVRYRLSMARKKLRQELEAFQGEGVQP